MDAHANFTYSRVATAPSPATSGTTLVVTTGDGAHFPTAPFNATVWPAGAIPLPANAEIVRVTGVSTDTLTIARTQEGTSARTIVAGDQIVAAITAKTLTDIETAVNLGQRVFDVTSPLYGAIGDGTTDDRVACQAAADACALAGGGTVLFPDGYTFAMSLTSRYSDGTGVLNNPSARGICVDFASNTRIQIDGNIKLLANQFGTAATTIGSPSGGQAGNSAIITVASTAGFSANGGMIYLPLTGATFAIVTYTGTTSTTFTGCTGGSGTIAANGTAITGLPTLNQAMLTNKTWNTGGDHDITFCGHGTIDGNRANNTATIYSGIKFWKTTRCNVIGGPLTIQNVRGYATGGVGETWAVDWYSSSDFILDKVRALNGSGFSHGNYSSNGHVTNCFASGMPVAHGYTQYQSRNIKISDCTAQLCAGHGFNDEHSDQIIYSGCLSGGFASYGSAGNASNGYTLGQTLGSGSNGTGYDAGFVSLKELQGAGVTRYINCNSIGNPQGLTMRGPGGVTSSWTSGTKTVVSAGGSTPFDASHAGATIFFLKLDGTWVSDTIATVTNGTTAVLTGTPAGLASGGTESFYLVSTGAGGAGAANFTPRIEIEDCDFSYNGQYGIDDVTNGIAGKIYTANFTSISPNNTFIGNATATFAPPTTSYHGYRLDRRAQPVVQRGGYYLSPSGGHTGQSVSPGSGNLRFSPVLITDAASITKMSFDLTAAGTVGKYRLGVYASDGTGLPTGAPLIDTGQQNLPNTTTGLVEFTLASLSVLPRGLFFCALLFDTLTGTYTTAATQGIQLGGVYGTVAPSTASNLYTFMSGQSTGSSLPTVSINAANVSAFGPNVNLKTG